MIEEVGDGEQTEIYHGVRSNDRHLSFREGNLEYTIVPNDWGIRIYEVTLLSNHSGNAGIRQGYRARDHKDREVVVNGPSVSKARAKFMILEKMEEDRSKIGSYILDNRRPPRKHHKKEFGLAHSPSGTRTDAERPWWHSSRT